MLQQESAADFVIATGKSHSLEDFAEISFRYFGLDWQEYTDIDASIFRPTDIAYGSGDARKALRMSGWSAKTDMSGVIEKMIAEELKSYR